jgi:putative tryptophan/tyrosine transport system substrate-binding protein
MIRRREFIAGLGGAAAWPVVARAQQADRVRRVGYLGAPISTGSNASRIAIRGLPGFYVTAWFAFFAPKGMPRPIIDKLNAATAEALAAPEVRAKFADLGLDLFPREEQTPEALAGCRRPTSRSGGRSSRRPASRQNENDVGSGSNRHQHRLQCVPDGYRLADKSLEGGDETAGVHCGTRQRGSVAARGAGAAAGGAGDWVLSAQFADDDLNRTVPFLQGLKETGYVDGQNVAVEYRYAENQFDRLPTLAADLVRRRVAVIVGDTTGALAAKAATTTTPIVFGTAGDPVALGLVASLNRPGANATGVANLNAELAPKRLQLLRQVIPNATRFGVLVDPTFPGIDLQAAARTLGLQLTNVYARTDSDLQTAFTTLSQQRVDAVMVSPSAFYSGHPEQLAALAARHALPAMFPNREFALAGGLMSYGDSADYWHQVGIYTGRILKGEKPADLPVVQAGKLELLINLKTAKALGLTIPETLLATADEVIQ